MDTKEEVVGGVAAAAFLVMSVVLGLFIWSPVFYYLGKWGNYWHDETGYVESDRDAEYYSKRIANSDKCEERVESFFNVPATQISSFASSTSETHDTYDCYGIKWQLIPQETN